MEIQYEQTDNLIGSPHIERLLKSEDMETIKLMITVKSNSRLRFVVENANFYDDEDE